MNTKTLHVATKSREYDIYIGSGVIKSAGKFVPQNSKAMIVTDENVPREYAEKVHASIPGSFVKTVPQGEGSKSIKYFEKLLSSMLEADFTRHDTIIAVGGGVTGDLAGFAASCYMRGIRFINIPTTLLSQVDSSVGGKTAVNLDGIKNVVGSFYQPHAVLIDPDTLKTLGKREFASGMAEVIKMATSLDEDFFECLEKADFHKDIETIIYRAVQNKIKVVTEDETEQGLRKVLNFGHTLGHGIEATTHLSHGESIALGMLPMSSGPVRRRLVPLLEKAGLKTSYRVDAEKAAAAASHDKKADGKSIACVKVNKIGSFEFEKMNSESLSDMFKTL